MSGRPDTSTSGTGTSVVSTEREGHVGTLWLDNAERRNAMGPGFWNDLPAAVEELDSDEAVRAIVLAAKGPHFSVGLDLKALPGIAGGDASRRPPSRAAEAAASYREIKRLQRAISSVADCRKPVVAAIQGYCIGGGVDLVSACDMRFCSSDAVFSVREARMAIVADLGSLQRLPRIIPAGHVAELAFTAKDIDAQRALRIGLVNDVLPDAAGALESARATAGQIADNSPLAVQGAKWVLAASAGRSVEEGLDYVAAWNAAFLASNDLAEAMRAFLERRPARFTGD
jgi:enoyl-CoA hydratase